MSSFDIYVREMDLEKVQTTFQKILDQVQKGFFDEDLKSAQCVGKDFQNASVDVSIGQNMSPESWLEITAVFGPVASQAARDVWKIVFVPQLKRVFHDRNVSEEKPSRKKPK